MNYGKSATMRRIRKFDSKGTKIKSKVKVLFCKFFLAIVIVFGAVGISSGIGVLNGIIDSAPDISAIDVTPTGYSSTVLASNGEETATLVASGANRQYATLDQIPIDLQHAFVAIEDERFYDHNGIDLYGIARAFASGIKNGGDFDQGASNYLHNWYPLWLFFPAQADIGSCQALYNLLLLKGSVPQIFQL